MKHRMTVAVSCMLINAPAYALELALPLVCDPGVTCIVQNYVDIDPGPGSQDYRCGNSTYNGHKGTDIRVRPSALSKDTSIVRAAAPGTVKAIRNGQAERFSWSDLARKAVAGRECGNGVVIAHGEGWETQYCHMKRGSVVVKAGQTVAVGDALGRIGNSGETTFYHLHIAVRFNGAVVDPFLGQGDSGACRQAKAFPSTTLWTPGARRTLTYRGPTVFMAGFTTGKITREDMEHGKSRRPTPASPALVFFTGVVHVARGDRIRLDVTGPAGFAVRTTTPPMERAKAQYTAFAGKRRTTAAWPAGRYIGRVTVLRGKAVVGQATRTLVMSGEEVVE